MSLLHADLLLLRIYNEDRVRKNLHLLDATDVSLKLLPLLLDQRNFLLRKNVEGAILCHLLDLLQTLDTSLDGLEVCKHTAEPSLVYVELTTTKSLCLYSILCLLLGTYEKNSTTVLYDLYHRVVGIVYHLYGLLKIDDVDTVTLCVDVRSHLRVPSSCLMTKVYASLKELLHSNCTHFNTSWLFLPSQPSCLPAFALCGYLPVFAEMCCLCSSIKEAASQKDATCNIT